MKLPAIAGSELLGYISTAMCGKEKKALRVVPGIVDLTKDRTCVTIINKGKEPLVVYQDEILARCQEHPDQPETLKPPECPGELRSLLEEYNDVFLWKPNDLGRVSVIEHAIDTGTAEPIRQKARRIPFRLRERVRIMIQYLEKTGVIRKSSSPWASPIVIVRKPDGDLRLCVDYRKVNNITKVDAYQIPRIDEVFDVINGAQYFSTLDIASMYWQIPVRPQDIEKTAFIVPFGLYEFTAMPFGLINAPATAVRLMNQVLCGLIGHICYVYFDDILIYSADLPEHLERCRAVFDRLRKFDLRLRPNKCRFLRESVSYLGYSLSARGILPSTARIRVLMDLPVPRTKTEVRSFLGLGSYFRRFVPNFARIAKPLHELTKLDVDFHWEADQQAAFNELKERLCSPPILVHYDPEASLELRTDACDYAIGGLLLQKDPNGQVGVLHYISRLLSDAERKYAVTEKECLAVVYALPSYTCIYLDANSWW